MAQCVYIQESLQACKPYRLCSSCMLAFCSVTRICIRKRFLSRVVDYLYKHPSNTYIVTCSDLLWIWTLHKFPHGQFTQVIDVRSLYPSTNSYRASHVDWCSVFGLVLAKPSPNKPICFSYAVLLFVVEWRQNLVKCPVCPRAGCWNCDLIGAFLLTQAWFAINSIFS